ncbi:MAG TPA: 16S rRNA (cytidine(1402)-2'-O)-methyltransferase [Actinomycetota bacterium]|jgi:16S rRNA (cytidine1402-2'-O)-methyltransferase
MATSTGTLFVVGTPIGNLEDLSDRARRVLASVDLIAAEDTRRTGRLLKAIGIAGPRLLSLHDSNERARVPEVLSRLEAGANVALTSDGGMPLVSDPGYRLVRAVADRGIEIAVVPGPSAVVAALAVAGLPTDRWAFEGFLPKRAGDRRRRLEAVAHDERTLVFFESPLRVRAMLTDLAAVLGDRPAALCRELTKLHEEVLRGSASSILESLGTEDPRGEVVLVVAGATAVTGDLDAAVEVARHSIADGDRPREASRAAAERFGVSANAVYRALLGGADATHG